jgi:hypothetical protein
LSLIFRSGVILRGTNALDGLLQREDRMVILPRGEWMVVILQQEERMHGGHPSSQAGRGRVEDKRSIVLAR